MKVLILGAKGSLGQTFVDVYHDEQVIAWDREDLDITNEKMANEKIKYLSPDLIINCAAYNNVDKAEEDKAAANLLNGTAVGFIATAAEALNATLVHFSSAYVFDGTSQVGYNEDDANKPLSVYGHSKLLGEEELADKALKYYIVRTTWLYGRESLTGKPSFVDLMLKLAADGKEIKGITDEYGQPTFVLDLAHATRALVEEKKVFGVYHLVNAGRASWFDWAKEIFQIKNITANLIEGKIADFQRAAKRPQYGILNNTKFISLRPWQEALKEYLSK